MTNGIEISYNSTPVDKAADYSKTIDSRWKFLEVAFEGNFKVTLPAIASGGDPSTGLEQQVLVMAHNLNFFPLFEANVVVLSGTLAGSPASQSAGTVYADRQNLYLFPTYDPFDGQNSITVYVEYRVYKLDVTQSYNDVVEPFTQAQISKSSYGAKFLDQSAANVDIDDVSSVGFSIDTSKKTISIHSVQTVYLALTNPPTTINHDVGYPPTYMISLAPTTVFSAGYTTKKIPYRYQVFTGAVFVPIAYITATSNTLQIKGIQGLFGGSSYTIVILKDPIGIAQ